MNRVPLALVVGDQHAGPSPAPPNRPGCIICQDPTAPGSDWCPTHLTQLRDRKRPETPRSNPPRQETTQ